MPTEETMIKIFHLPTTSSDPEVAIDKSLGHLPGVEKTLILK